MAEGAVKAESVQLLAVGSYTRRAVYIEKDIRAGVDGMGKCDGLLRRLIEPKNRKWEIEPRSDDENGDGDHDAGDSQSPGRDDRD